MRAAIDAAAAAGLPAITLTTFRDLAREASLGLPAARRCAMRREIAAARR
ncbi:acetyltransferase [Bordetella pertussis]|nr:acetyltransferase [Bordetella pertussis]